MLTANGPGVCLTSSEQYLSHIHDKFTNNKPRRYIKVAVRW
jgi:hypothetical protein